MGKRSKTKKTESDKILDKLYKQWDMLCECTHDLTSHKLDGCMLCPMCTHYIPVMSVDLVKEVS